MTDLHPAVPGAGAAGRYYPSRYPEPEPTAGKLDLGLLFTVAWRWRYLILSVIVLGTLLAGAIGYYRTPIYRAEALVMLSPRSDRIVEVNSVSGDFVASQMMIDTQIQFITSPFLLGEVIDRLGLLNDPPPPPGFVARITGLANRALTRLPPQWQALLGVDGPDQPLAAESGDDIARENLIATMTNSLLVTQEGRSLVLSLSYAATDPERAAQVVNTLAQLFIDVQVDQRVGAAKRASDWLDARLGEMKDQLFAADEAVERYRTEHRLFESGGQSLPSQQISSLNGMLVQTRAERSEKEVRLQYIRELQKERVSLQTLSEVLDSPYMSRLWDQEQALHSREVETTASLGPKHPQVLAIRAENGKLQAKVNTELARVVDNIANDIKVLQGREESLQKSMDELTAQDDSLSIANIKLRELERQAEASRLLYQSFLQRYKETDEEQKLATPNAQILSRPAPPTDPSSLGFIPFVAIGFTTSSLLGLAFAWFMDGLDNRLRSSKEVEGTLGIPCLGMVPYLSNSVLKKGRRPHQYLIAKPLSTYAETFRMVQMALRPVTPDRPAPRVIQVTSGVPDEGKTIFSMSFATSLAQNGHTVALVDLDLRNPSIFKETTGTAPGRLIECLTGQCSLDEAIQHDEFSGVALLSNGIRPSNPTVLLASGRLRELIDRLRARYEYVIIDSTPVLGVSDTKLIAELADATILVAEWAKLARDISEDTVKELLDHNVHIAGVVISKVNFDQHARHAYSGKERYFGQYKKYYVN